MNRLLEAQDKLRSEEESKVAAEKQVKELQARLEGLSADQSKEASFSFAFIIVSQVSRTQFSTEMPILWDNLFSNWGYEAKAVISTEFA